MSTPRTSLASSFLLLAAIAVGGPQARAAAPTPTPDPVAATASMRAEQGMRLAQKADDDEDKKRKGKRPDKGDGKDKRDRAGGQKRDGQQARDKAPERKPDAKAVQDNRKKLEAQQARERALKQKQQADQARKNAAKQKQLEAQKAKEKALKAKRDAEAARGNSAVRARETIIKRNQQGAQQAREKALKEQQEAEAARRNAAKQKELEAQRAKQQQDAEAARRNAAKKKQEATRKDTRKPPAKKYDRTRVDQEFDRARKDAQQRSGSGPNERWRADSVRKFEDLRKGRKTREVGSRELIVEPDKRVIVRDDKRTFIRHDESERFTRRGKEVRRERRKDGTWLVITAGLVAGAVIHSIMDDDGRVIRRSRRDRDGREYVLFDDRRAYRGHSGPGHYGYVDLPPPVVRIPRDRYIVEYDRASLDDIYDALNAPPVEDLDRGYSLDEIRQNYSILERMRRVDLNAVNFAFASWDIGPDQYEKLERIAQAMRRVLDRSPNELFLIEGHTDAVGSEIDNLSLSDRRAETVAIILSDEFGIPPENLTTQGYGEEYLKELTDGPSWINRRVAVRRITPLLSRDGWDDDPS